MIHRLPPHLCAVCTAYEVKVAGSPDSKSHPHDVIVLHHLPKKVHVKVTFAVTTIVDSFACVTIAIAVS